MTEKNDVPVGQSPLPDHDDPHLTARIAAHERELENLRHRYQITQDDNLARDIKLAEIVLNLGYQDKQLAKIVSAVEGNGKPGLGQRLSLLEQTEGERKILRRAVTGSVVASAVSFVFYLFKSITIGHK